MKAALLLILVGLVAGCGTMPSQVEFPTNAADGDSANPAEARYRVKDKLLSEYKEGDTTLVVERTYEGMMAQIKAHRVLWDNEARDLAKGVDVLGNTQFAGVTLGGIGALADSIGAATTGAAIAGGAGIWGNRYKLDVQAANYRTAAEAMQCIRTQIEKVPLGFWNAYYVDGEYGLRFDVGFFRRRTGGTAQGDEARAITEGYDTLVSLHQKVHDAIESVRKKLFTAQMNTKLAMPSIEDISSALKRKQDNQDNVEKQANAMGVGANESFTRMETAGTTLQAALVGAKEDAAAAANKTYIDTLKGLLGLQADTVDEEDYAAAERAASESQRVLQDALQLPIDLEICTKSVGS